MTVQEYRSDWIKQGFIIQEGIVPATNQLQILIMKTDVDGLRFEHRLHPGFDILESKNINYYIDNIKEVVYNISTAITNRHDQNVNSCQHEPITIGNKKGCGKCLGSFGSKINIDLNYN